MANARENAERLAELAGVKLGRVLAIQPAPTAQDESSPAAAYSSFAAMMMMGMMGAEPQEGPGTTAYREIPVRVSLLVRFEILEGE
jgi:uncharacterized protein YggE